MNGNNRHIGAALVAITVCLLAATSAATFGQEDRETWQPPEKIMDAIGVEPKMRIGEAGAGTGYFTFPLAGRVGPEGIVFANDISTSSLDVIRDRADAEGLANIKTVVGAVEDPLFPETDLDMVIMVYVLHLLEIPGEVLRNVRKYMGPGALLVIIERNSTRDRAHYPSFMTKKQVLETMGETGYALDRTETFLSKDTIYIYRAMK
jgi:ubiquinone/menaquinone biosynthesis C-methylase UbiE